MEFELNGQIVTLEGLDPTVDSQLPLFYRHYLGAFREIPQWFEMAAFDYFNKFPDQRDRQDKFFEALSGIGLQYFSNGRYDATTIFWKFLVEMALRWEDQHPGKRIHKGTPFYWWAVALIVKGDLDTGYLVMHQALDEDIKTTAERGAGVQGVLLPQTPPAYFLTLNYLETAQAFRWWLQYQIAFLEERISRYRSLYARQFTLDDFRIRFLFNPPNIDSVFIIAYSLARLMQIDQTTPKYTLKNNFAGQFERNVLFSISTVLDEAIKAKNGAISGFRALCLFLSNSANLGLVEQDFSDLNTPPVNDRFQELLNGTRQLRNGGAMSGLAIDLAVTYLFRNHYAHRITSVPTLWQEYERVSQCALNVLFLIIETLY